MSNSKDIEFLTEMKLRLEKAKAGDWSEAEMLTKMIDDWIDELGTTKKDAVKEAERKSFNAGVCVSLACVMAQDSGVLWKEIVRTCGEDELLRYAAIEEPEEWQLAGFAKYARNELRRNKPRAVSATV